MPLLPAFICPVLRACRLRTSCSFPLSFHRVSSPTTQHLSRPSSSLSSAHCAPYPSRTHTCGALSARDAGSRVILTGWLLPERKTKLVSFFPLKDSSGTVQLMVNHAEARADASCLSDVPVESSVWIQGQVLLRPPSARRPGPAGEIDVQVEKFLLLNPADTNLPFVPSSPHNLPSEELRLRYRYLDLRRSALSENLRKRSRVAHIVRNSLHEDEFVEVETPVLLRSSVEGAREFLVPTRTSNEPSFYALQQSPQQPKQLLISSGAVDRYFQIAKCFRDEDGRKDRQPEFTQIDLEMAYVSWGNHLNSSTSQWSDNWRIGGIEVRNIVETLIRKIWRDLENMELPEQFKVMTYHEAMTRFGSDKPDTRFDLEIRNITDFLPPEAKTSFEQADEILECIVIRRSQHPEFWTACKKSEIEQSVEFLKLTEGSISSWLLRNKTVQSPNTIQSGQYNINEVLGLVPGDYVLLSRRVRTPKGGSTALGRQRIRLLEAALALEQPIVLPEAPHFLWITEFPLFTQSDDDKDFLAKGRWSSSHHPFTAPMWEDVEALYNGEVDSVRGQHYDLVLNGMEIGGGSVRVHDAVMQEYIFSNVLQLTELEKAPFNHLLHALRCGAPPHGGIALGFDRLMSILCKTSSIRDVIAFPKTSVGTDLLFKSPAAVDPATLEQYGIQPRTR
ncbi:aspartate--tRNA ligase msd1 [Stygiomarasmius scandens]|uniref:Aspartate--tRNA ligase msd1 n=1 Tax=Marasmiellus scandens TaxID=2682957 RepID=A0ABR1K5L0_9AGAR